ncbi:MAG: hypothetical protein N2Z72_04570 [Bacteroidales bacterium]|nr:hypothetical protein [Bacteroidales bacterium]
MKGFTVKFMTLCVFVFYMIEFFSQEIPPIKKSRLQAFLSSTMHVVKTDDPFGQFNDILVQSVEKTWKVTSWKVISSEEFEKKMNQTQASFLYLSEGSIPYEKSQVQLNLLCISMGSKSGEIDKLQDVILAPLNYFFSDDEDEENEYLYKVPGYVKVFHYAIEYNKTQPEVTLDDICKANEGTLPQMELWLLEENVTEDLKDPQRIQKWYTGKIKMVSREQMLEAAMNGTKGIALGYTLDPKNKTGLYYLKLIFSASDGKILYYKFGKASSMRDGKFDVSDLKSFK